MARRLSALKAEAAAFSGTSTVIALQAGRTNFLKTSKGLPLRLCRRSHLQREILVIATTRCDRKRANFSWNLGENSQTPYGRSMIIRHKGWQGLVIMQSC